MIATIINLQGEKTKQAKSLLTKPCVNHEFQSGAMPK